mmetsp:Transcript_17686/g.12731  ORF Transcript_17686/g.12731 Transcript_17686/m.12731 type:complete len:84 (+) Transcript_17686:52-303(+)|eukprot:CAMPEP_0116876584 /NCGR_PEP_ID=MMETSP0463-20121206/8491_1 /TAXON_ID=181622 /ORGANISM="Strombidinopsis sp, Strain SopsisLIS2011" /LENGTH=83 /DNA_ID=CAMNT_0004523265 /DNA_START=48 /DNA_END=299 /DNA_ORIENTATION=-
MEKLEAFYFSDGGDGGEEIFNKFAEKHANLFDDGCDAKETENKLEYTQAYEEFCKEFEEKIEVIIKECNITVEQFYEAMKHAT